jgi:hypothetical protein
MYYVNSKTGGATQRGIESQGIAADIAQFEQERDYDKNNTLFMQSLLQSLPLETQSYSYIEPSGLQTLAGGANDIQSILDLLSRPNNSGTGPDGGYSQATQSAALQGQYDYYVAMGQTPAQAMASAKADLGIG